MYRKNGAVRFDLQGGQDPLLLLKTLQLLWTKKEMKKLKEEIRRGFAGLEDPLAGLLDMLESSSDWKGKGHSLGYYITTEFQLWIKEHPAVQQLQKLQARVLRILAQCPANLLDPLISIYQLHTADRNYLLGHVSHLYHKGDYKELKQLRIAAAGSFAVSCWEGRLTGVVGAAGKSSAVLRRWWVWWKMAQVGFSGCGEEAPAGSAGQRMALVLPGCRKTSRYSESWRKTQGRVSGFLRRLACLGVLSIPLRMELQLLEENGSVGPCRLLWGCARSSRVCSSWPTRREEAEGFNIPQAAILSIKLKLQPDQDVEKMCTPLLLQDKTNLVEEYVGEYPELQSKLLQILDTWCEPGFNIRDITRQYQGLSRYKPDKFNRKMLSKLIFRLLDRFNVDP
ncbi:PREDICTED: exonuclease mut-7 homolog, partial [Phaethon lepturus]|uniref:exonuclease mut-7 homolog n=1 Tax=Phaethon lepturus TaxID=97097 RepID=UPI0005305EB0